MGTQRKADQGGQAGQEARAGAAAGGAQHAQQHAAGWRLDAAALRATAPGAMLLANIEPESLRVHLPRQLEGHTMAAFEARAVQRLLWEGAPPEAAPGATPARRGGGGRQQQQTTGEQQPRDRETVVDGLLYAGGPVWTLDWAPWPNRSSSSSSSRQEGAADACELLALSTHPKGLPRTRVGSPQRGPGALQLWAVPHSAPAATAAAGPCGGDGGQTSAAEVEGGGVNGGCAALPRCLALIPHQGKLAWEVRWCPDPSALLAGGAAALADGTLSPPAAAAASSSSSSSGGAQVAGVLAAVLGDGSVQIYVVPALHHLAALAAEYRRSDGAAAARINATANGSSGEAQGPEAAAAATAAAAAAAGVPELDLNPVASLTPDEMGGSPASCCAWCPARPHDVLLVGCWDGHVAAWRLPTARDKGVDAPHLLLRVRAETCPIRCITWQPDGESSTADNGEDGSGDGSGDGTKAAAAAAAPREDAEDGSGSSSSSSSGAPGGGRCFMTASQWGDLRFWDPVDLSAPLVTRSFSRAAATAVAWARASGAVVGLFADGGVRVVFTSVVGIAGLLKSKNARAMFLEGPDPSPMWSISFHPTQPVAAYCGDSGVFGLLPVEPPLTSRRHLKPAAVVSAMAIGGGDDLWVLTAADIPPGGGGLFPGGSSQRREEPSSGDAGKRGYLHDPRQALHAAAFSPNTATGGAVWAAVGGAAGVVRVHRVTVVVEGADENDAVVG